jgi:cytochrome oxidase Cu insertion factor (SCO1/SenC/PrrC family)
VIVPRIAFVAALAVAAAVAFAVSGSRRPLATAATREPAPPSGIASGDLEFTPPPPGSYDLPVIDTIDDHLLVDSAGRPTSLYALKGRRLAVVALVYTSCPDPQGCPLATAALYDLDRRLAADRELRDRVTLLSLSFDPERDRPERLAALRASYAPKADWRLATTDTEHLEALLADFMHPVARQRGADGRPGAVFRHTLRVYLLDDQHRVRNIYSAGFLSAELVMNDLRTLLLESAHGS